MLVAVDRLPQQCDLLDPLPRERLHFTLNVARPAGLLRAAGGGDDAVGAELVAADHDPHERLPRAGPHRRVAERVVTGEAAGHFVARAIPASQRDRHLLLAQRANFVDQPGDFRELTRANDEVNVRRLLEDQLLILLGHAADDPDHLPRPLSPPVLEPADRAVDLVLGMLADAAGVEQHGIGRFGVIAQFVPPAAAVPPPPARCPAHSSGSRRFRYTVCRCGP